MTLEELKQRRYDPSMGDGYYWVWVGDSPEPEVFLLDDGYIEVGTENWLHTNGCKDMSGWIKIEPPEVGHKP